MPPTDVMFTRHVAGRMDDRQPNSVCRYRGLTVVSTRPTPLIPYIPSSRLDQHGAHDAALKAVRPRLRLRALRLDRDAAHAPAQTSRNYQKNGRTHPDQRLDRPRS
jgi:hypothetical protein